MMCVAICGMLENKGVTKEGVTPIWGEKKTKGEEIIHLFLQHIFVT
jgi:hypothetical protein